MNKNVNEQKHYGQKRLTFETWHHISHHWVNGLTERMSLINRPFKNPIFVHPSFLPKPDFSTVLPTSSGVSLPPPVFSDFSSAPPISTISRSTISANVSNPSPQPHLSAIPIHDLSNLDHLDVPTKNHGNEAPDLILFSPFLQWTQDIPGMLIQTYRALANNGFFIGCFFGQDSLLEFKNVCANLDSNHYGGLHQRFMPMIHTKDAGTLMQRAGFQCPTADIEHLTYSAEDITQLVHALRDSHLNHPIITHPNHTQEAHYPTKEAHYPTKAAHYRPLPRTFLKEANAAYLESFSTTDTKLRVTLDLIFICGWKQTKPPSLNKDESPRLLSPFL